MGDECMGLGLYHTNAVQRGLLVRSLEPASCCGAEAGGKNERCPNKQGNQTVITKVGKRTSVPSPTPADHEESCCCFGTSAQPQYPRPASWMASVHVRVDVRTANLDCTYSLHRSNRGVANGSGAVCVTKSHGEHLIAFESTTRGW